MLVYFIYQFLEDANFMVELDPNFVFEEIIYLLAQIYFFCCIHSLYKKFEEEKLLFGNFSMMHKRRCVVKYLSNPPIYPELNFVQPKAQECATVCEISNLKEEQLFNKK